MFDISMTALCMVLIIGLTVNACVEDNNRTRLAIAQMECQQ